jgi:hypothetical protein
MNASECRLLQVDGDDEVDDAMTARSVTRCVGRGGDPGPLGRDEKIQPYGVAAAAAEEDAAAEDAEAIADTPWGLAAENPGSFAEATAASQFRETNTWFTADAEVFCGAGTVRETWLTT